MKALSPYVPTGTFTPSDSFAKVTAAMSVAADVAIALGGLYAVYRALRSRRR